MMIEFRQVLIQLLVALVVLALANGLIARQARNSAPRQVLKRLEQPASIEGIFAGNSLVEAGFNPAAFDQILNQQRAAGPFLNAGLGSTTPVEHLLFVRDGIAHHPETRRIIYGFFDQQLTEIPTGGWNDLINNRVMDYYVEPDFAAEMYAPRSPWLTWRIRTIGYVPMLVERMTLWAKVERVRRQLAAIGMPAETNNRFGRAADFSALEAASIDRFATLCRQTVQQRLPLTPAVDELLRECDAHRPAISAVVVAMPMSPEHRERFYSIPEWNTYLDYVSKLLKQKHCRLIVASDWIDQQQSFADHLHLNADGAVRFSQRLALELNHAGQP